MNFSVSMSVYEKDDPQYFKTALESIFNQTVKPTEVVLVVDGPIPDVTSQIIEAFKASHSNLKVYCLEKNMGHGISRRTGLDKCTCKLIAIMDSDDISVPERFEKELKCFQDDKDLSIVGSYIQEFEGDVGKLARKNIQVKAFLVSGEADESNEYFVKLQEQISNLKIKDNIVFTGFKPNPYEILANAKVSVLCCEKEGCPNLVMESMACKTPIVVPGAGGAGELVEDGVTGLKFITDDSDSLAQCLQNLLENKELSGNITKKAFAHVYEKFSYKEHMTQLRKRFEEVVSK